MKILVYPGTFDPIHAGHIDSLRRAMREKEYDAVYIVLQTNRFKEGTMFTYEARLKFVQAALTENWMNKIEIITTDSEYFFDTLDNMGIIQTVFSGLHSIDVLIGDDCLGSIEKWMHFNLLSKYCRFVIVQRMLRVKPLCSTAQRIFERFYVISLPNNADSITVTSTAIRGIIGDVLKAWRISKTTILTRG